MVRTSIGGCRADLPHPPKGVLADAIHEQYCRKIQERTIGRRIMPDPFASEYPIDGNGAKVRAGLTHEENG